MGKRIFLIMVAAAVFIIQFSGTAVADGGIFGKEGRDIYEPQQKAVLFHHEGMEELILSVRYEGAAEEFAWLVPLPEPPQIEECDFTIFELMSALAPTESSEEGLDGLRYMGVDAGVDLLDEMTVGPYDIAVVETGNASDLRAWLVERGFSYDEGAERVLADYIDRGWCFAAMRINPQELSESGYELAEGTIDPLRFTFASQQPVYPLYISSLNPGESEVLIYALGDEAYSHPDMQVEFADAWRGSQIGELKDFSNLAGALEEDGDCLVTKLRAEFSPQDMKDLYLVPAASEALEPWPAVLAGVSGKEGGSSFPLVAIPFAVFLLACLVAASLAIFLPGTFATPWRFAGAFGISAIVFIAVFLPLSLGEHTEGEPAGKVEWPWEKDIRVSDNGWSKLIHADGRVEILGLDELLEQTLFPGEIDAHEYPPDLVSPTNELDDGGEWEWSVRQYRADTWQTRYLRVTNTSNGEVREADIGMVEVHDVRLSPQGDALWIAMNPGVPENKTEVREYSFPSLDLRRSLMHDACMRVGEIVLSPQGEPMLAGRFAAGDEYMDTYFGFLPLLQEGAGFSGYPLKIGYDDIQNNQDTVLIGILNSYPCDAVDASPYLLISGVDFENGSGIVYVLDANDGELYEVGEGAPRGWQ